MTNGDSAAREQRFEQALAACVELLESEGTVDRAALLDRFPEFAGELAEFLADRDRVDRLAIPPTLETSSPKPTEMTPGTMRYFGDYELLEEIARGGMGIVYKARQVSLNRTVALKMILAGELATEADVRRFHAEAEAVALLDHPYIVPVYEVGEHQGQHYFTMRLIEGGNLSGAKFPPREAARLMATVARAVHHANQRGILHRDLKPANVLLDSQGQPHVTDFGLARRVQGSARTLSGAVVGTPAYMPPEQAQARADLTIAADVYGLGAILYELLTGRPPFRSDSPLETLRQVMESDPIPPRRIVAAVPRDLEIICLKCLEKAPARRYASAADLADDLSRWLAGESIRARPTGSVERAARWIWRRPVVAALLAVSLAAAVVLVFFLLEHRSRTELAALNTQLENARNEAERQRETGRRLQYAADMQLAQRFLLDMRNVDDLDRVLELLERQRPQAGESDLRGFEWYHLWRQCNRARTTLPGGQADSFGRVAFVNDGRDVLIGDAKGKVQVWNPKTDQFRTLVPAEADFDFRRLLDRTWLTQTPDGQSLVVSSENAHSVSVLNIADGQEQLSLWKNPKQTAELAALSPDGERAALSRTDGVVRICDAKTGKLINETAGCAKHRSHVAIARRDPLLLAVSCEDGTVRLRDETGQEIATLRGHGDIVSAMAFSPDGKQLATVDFDREVRLWDVASARGNVTTPAIGPQLTIKPLRRDSIVRLLYSPDGSVLFACASEDREQWAMECVLWDVAKGKERARLSGHVGGVLAVAFSPDGRTLATAGYRDGTIHIWDVDSGSERAVLRGHTVAIFDLAFRPDGRQLVSAGGTSGFDNIFKRGEVKIWDAETWEEITSLSGCDPWTLAPDGRNVALADGRYRGLVLERTQNIGLFNLASGRLTAQYDGDFGTAMSPGALAFTPDGRTLVRALNDGRELRFWDTDTGKPRGSTKPIPRDKELQAPAPHIPVPENSFVAFAPDGRTIVSGYSQTSLMNPEMQPQGVGKPTLLFWNPDGTQRLQSNQAWGPVQFSADGLTLAAHSAEGGVKVFDMPSGRLRCTTVRVPHRNNDVVEPTRFSLSSDASRIAIMEALHPSNQDGPVRIYDAKTGRLTATLQGQTRGIRSLAFSIDGKVLATGHGESSWVSVGWIKLWDADTGQEISTLWGHHGGVHDLLFTPDGKRLISASSSDVKLWDPVVRQVVMSLPGGGKLQMTPDGRTLAVGPTGDNDSHIRLWRE
jgi:WD40 repeat protein